MNAKLASIAVSTLVGVILLFMGQNPSSKEMKPSDNSEKPKILSAKERPKETKTLKTPRVITLPPPPNIRSSSRPRLRELKPVKETQPNTKKVEVAPLKPTTFPKKLTSKKVEVAPLKPTTFPKKLTSIENVRKPLVPRPTAVLKKSDTEHQSKKVPAKATSVNSVSQTLTLQETKEGRKLLRVLEAGKGPVVTLSWPSRKAERERVYSSLTECYAMKTVVYVENSGLYRTEDPRGAKWSLNSDAMSTFIRRPSGGFSGKERRIIASINSRHSLRSGIPVRIFPRSVDAALLGGLKRIIGDAYSSAETISAAYFIYDGGVGLTNVRKDGIVVAGRFALPRLRRCS